METNKTELIPSIQWFPGHMTKTKRMIEKNLSMVDLVLELTDARIPASSKNPELDKWVNNKPRIVLLNKSDRADKAATQRWIAYYRSKGIVAVETDSKNKQGMKDFYTAVQQVMGERLDRWQAKGMVGRTVRVMVVGIPNVGKSTFINCLAGSKRAKAEDRPGVTRAKQWVSLDGNMDLLDTPGVLWPKFEDPAVGERLAFTGAVKDDVLDIEWLGARLASYLEKAYPKLLHERFKLTDEDTAGLEAHELLALLGKKRGMLIGGGEVDTERAAIMLLDEYRAGKIGRITLEQPPQE